MGRIREQCARLRVSLCKGPVVGSAINSRKPKAACSWSKTRVEGGGT